MSKAKPETTTGLAPTNRRANRLIFLGFVIISALAIFQHEFWVDEARAWLIARDASISHLFSVLRYESHPPGWYLLLKMLIFIGAGPTAMKALNFAFGTFAFSRLAFFSPFSVIEKMLLAVNYFLLYEATVNSRSYAPLIAILFTLCSLYPTRQAHRWLFVVLCGLAAETHLWGFIVGAIFVFELILEGGVFKDWKAKSLLFLAFAFISLPSLLCMRAPADGPLSYWKWKGLPNDGVVSFLVDALRLRLSWLFECLFLLPRPNQHLWNGDLYPPSWIGFLWLPLLPVLLILFIYLSRRKLALTLFIVSTAYVIMIEMIRPLYDKNIRNYGTLVLTLFVCVWIARLAPRKKMRFDRVVQGLFMVILCAEAYAGLVTILAEFAHPYSNGRNVATYLRRPEFARSELIPELPFFSSSYMIYLDKPFYSYFDRRYVNFTGLTLAEATGLDLSDRTSGMHTKVSLLRDKIDLISAKRTKPFVLISYYRMNASTLKALGLKEVKAFSDAICPTENFYLYEGL